MENSVNKIPVYYTIVLKRSVGDFPAYMVYANFTEGGEEKKKFVALYIFKDESEPNCQYWGKETAYQQSLSHVKQMELWDKEHLGFAFKTEEVVYVSQNQRFK